MDNQTEVKKPNWKQLSIILLVVVALLIGVIIYLTQQKQLVPEPIGFDTSNGMLQSMEETEEWVVVTTEYGTIRYPFNYADMIAIKPVKEASYAALEFYAQLQDGAFPIYTIWFGREQGTPLGMIANQENVYVDAFLEIIEPSKKLKDSDLTSFYAAQETVNDVLASLPFEE